MTENNNKKKSERNDFLKLVAIISMAIDHVGSIFFPSLIIFRIIGRLALPIFAFGMVQGYKHTSNLPNYMARILTVGLISQLPYAILFDTYELNILFLLFISLALLYVIDKKIYIGVVPIALIMYFFEIDYGWYGLIMVYLFFIFDKNRLFLVTGQGILLSIFSYIKMSITYPFQMLGIFLVIYFPQNLIRVKLNRNIFYWFYPLHLIYLLILKILIT